MYEEGVFRKEQAACTSYTSTCISCVVQHHSPLRPSPPPPPPPPQGWRWVQRGSIQEGSKQCVPATFILPSLVSFSITPPSFRPPPSPQGWRWVQRGSIQEGSKQCVPATLILPSLVSFSIAPTTPLPSLPTPPPPPTPKKPWYLRGETCTV